MSLVSSHRQIATGLCAIVFFLVCAAGLQGGDPIQPQPVIGDPLDGLTADQLERFFEGKVAFDRVFQANEGLGPILNQNRCGACHGDPALGGAGSITVTRFGHAGEKGGFDPLEELGGSLLQSEAIDPDCEEILPPPEIANRTATRATPSTFGFGLIEAIADADLEFYADNPPIGISGRVHMVQPLEDPEGPARVGRFGWKAQVATVLSFSGDASRNEMGITNDLVPTENDPNGINPPELVDCDVVPDPEDVPNGKGIRFIDEVTDFQRFLAPPPQTPKSGMSGEGLFELVGCTDCHIASFTTPDDENLEEALRNKTFKPYSDFLLHEMGLLFDGIVQGDAQEGEIRTPPLWGLRFKDPMLHDASVAGMSFSDRVIQAIMDHGQQGSEALVSVQEFNLLLPAQKQAVVAFLDSLGRAEFDHDGDNDRDLLDFFDLVACSMLDVDITPDDPCAVHDIDQNGLVDLSDFESFMLVYEGARGDCDCNGITDIQEVFQGAADADMNAIPDACEPVCVADTDCSGDVAIDDLLDLLSAWGDCTGGLTPCPADNNGDNIVDIDDLLGMLASWGNCL